MTSETSAKFIFFVGLVVVVVVYAYLHHKHLIP